MAAHGFRATSAAGWRMVPIPQVSDDFGKPETFWLRYVEALNPEEKALAPIMTLHFPHAVACQDMLAEADVRPRHARARPSAVVECSYCTCRRWAEGS